MRLTVQWQDRSREPHAGQFYMLRAWAADATPILSRPISVDDFDNQTGALTFLYQVKGEGTHKLAALKKDDTLTVTGPCGNGFDTAALAGQYIANHFDELARQDQYRPIFQQLCPQIGCTVPSKVDIDRIKSSNLVVRSHPEFAGALVVDAILYNRAPFSQPFPLLELRFADLNGKMIASRRFKPGEYLSGDLAKAEMPPQTPIHIALDILDPGPKAVNYSLSFHSPE